MEERSDDTSSLADAIRNGNAFSDDFNRVESATSLWNALIEALQGSDILEIVSGKDLTSLTSSMPVHIQRLLGGILAVSELLCQVNTNNASAIVDSLRLILAPDFPEGWILELVQNYRSYFPYSYMFIRRMGRTPNAPVDAWERAIYHCSQKSSDNDSRDIIGPSDGTGNGGEGDNTAANDVDILNNSDSYEEGLQRINHRDSKWLVSDSEEGEDSEEEDVIEHRRHASVHQKKRMTRMSASPARRTNPTISSLSRATQPTGEVNKKLSILYLFYWHLYVRKHGVKGY